MAWCIRCGEHTPWWKFWRWGRPHICRLNYVQMEPRVRRHMKVSELRQIDTPERDDVLLIVDISDNESKKISLAQLKAFIKS